MVEPRAARVCEFADCVCVRPGLAAILFALFPIVYVLSASFSAIPSLTGAQLVPDDITLENFRVEGARTAGLYFSGPAENIRGDVTVVGTPLDCLANQGAWSATSLTQTGGAVLLLNGSELEASNLKTSCR